jgi:subfamily B ATP-binding cassette protein HlyB/CyaB
MEKIVEKEKLEVKIEEKNNTALRAFQFIAGYYDVNVQAEQLLHTLNIEESDMNETQMLKAAKLYKLKSRICNVKSKKIDNLPLPAAVKDNDGNFFVLAKLDDNQALIFDLNKNIPQLIKRDELLDIYSGIAVTFAKKSIIDRDVKFGFKWFIPTIIKYKNPLLQVLLALLTLQIIGVCTPLLTQVVIDKALVNNSLSTLDVFIFGLFSIVVFELILGLAKNYVFTKTTSKMDVILGARLFDHLFALPLRYFETRRVGDTVARVREVENIRNFLTGTPMSSVLDATFIIVYIAVMFIYSTSLTAVVIISLPVFALLSAIVTPLFKSRLDRKWQSGADEQSFLVESVTGAQTIKALAIEPKMQMEWEDKLANYAKNSYKTAILGNNAGVIGQFIQKGFDLIILWLGAKMVMDGKLTVGQLIAFRMLSSRVSTPVLRLVQLWQEFQQAALSVKRLGDIFNSKTEPRLSASKTRMPSIKGDISFEKVHFRYNLDQSEVIKDISFDIPSGSVIGIVGRSGSGKSTIAKLIQRLYIPELGKITIDGSDIALADPLWLRRQIGVVLQENFLFNMTVRENIAIHKPGASIDEVINVAKIAGAHEFISELPEGYDTMIGEHGTGLSGGQKQRVAIARALLTNPKILIFDEATSALDYESENIIQNNLHKICEGRTVLIIAHRLSTIKTADKVMVIDKGQLVEYDTHENLMADKGLFYHLNMQQMRGETE